MIAFGSPVDNVSAETEFLFISASVTVIVADDVDDIDLVYTASIDGNATVDVTGDLLSITPFSNYNGQIAVEVSVSDGEYTISDSLILNVNSINNAHILEDILDQSVLEDGDFVYTILANDVDDTDLVYTASVDGNATVDVTGNLLSISPFSNYNGQIAVEVSVSDGQISSNTSFNLFISSVNDPPIPVIF